VPTALPFTGKAAEIGLAREIFVVNQLQSAGHIPYYSKVGDLRVGDTYFEIGGKGKSRRQLIGADSAFVVSDDMPVAAPGKTPRISMPTSP